MDKNKPTKEFNSDLERQCENERLEREEALNTEIGKQLFKRNMETFRDKTSLIKIEIEKIIQKFRANGVKVTGPIECFSRVPHDIQKNTDLVYKREYEDIAIELMETEYGFCYYSWAYQWKFHTGGVFKENFINLYLILDKNNEIKAEVNTGFWYLVTVAYIEDLEAIIQSWIY